ncbi:MAG TPA: hypothetical protein VNG11_03715 [Chloroflexota bacterium]|nr:hypothetical protein [Chloroflexota bacterium]
MGTVRCSLAIPFRPCLSFRRRPMAGGAPGALAAAAGPGRQPVDRPPPAQRPPDVAARRVGLAV